MIIQYVLDLLDRECIELHDLRVRSKGRRHNLAGLVLACRVHDHPCLVLSVLASPIRLTQEMRTALEKGVNDARTRPRSGLVRNLDQESCCHLDFPSDWSRPNTWRFLAVCRPWRRVAPSAASAGWMASYGVNCPRWVAICHRLSQGSRTIARRSPYGVSCGSSSGSAPRSRAR